MAYPVALAAGLALSAAGTGMQMAGAKKARDKMDDTRRAELLRQKGYQRDADVAYQANREKSDRGTAEAEMAAGAQRREQEYQAVGQNTLGVAAPLATPAAGNQTAGAASRTAANVQATGNAWTKLVNSARAKLGGGDDWQLNQAIRNQRAGEGIGIASSQARQSASLLPGEMEAASHAGDKLAGWGQLVSALGSVSGMYGATTAAPAAAGAGNTGWSAVNWTPAMAAQYGTLS
jgi:hypothetical protein